MPASHHGPSRSARSRLTAATHSRASFRKSRNSERISFWKWTPVELFVACLPARASKPTSEHVAFAFARSFANVAWAVACHRVVCVCCGRLARPSSTKYWLARCKLTASRNSETCCARGVLCAKFLSPHQRPLRGSDQTTGQTTGTGHSSHHWSLASGN